MSLNEWHCPNCGAVTRARMADAAPDALKARVDQLTGALTGVLDAWNDEDADLVAALDAARVALGKDPNPVRRGEP